jgi:Trypsin-like peptidase domain
MPTSIHIYFALLCAREAENQMKRLRTSSVLKGSFLCIAFLSAMCSAQVIVGNPKAVPAMTQLKKTVVFVYGEEEVKDDKGKSLKLNGAIGTAFIVNYPDPRGGPTYGFDYMVTAKHVLKTEAGGYLDKIRVRANKADGSGVAFGEVPVTDGKGNLNWFDDKEDPNADIAIAEVTLSSEVEFLTVPVSLFASDKSLKDANVIEGDAVYLVGLMPQFTGENRNYPVVRHGYIALLSDEPIPMGNNIKEKVFALELGSWPGQSGSPVFLSLGGVRGGNAFFGEAYSLLGVMLGYVKNGRPFEVSQTNSVLVGDTANVGISYVLPASEILKILDSPAAQKQRDELLQKDMKRGIAKPVK